MLIFWSLGLVKEFHFAALAVIDLLFGEWLVYFYDFGAFAMK